LSLLTEEAYTLDPSLSTSPGSGENAGPEAGAVLTYRRELRFDRRGLLESESYFNADDSPGSRILYFYDNQGRLIRREFHHPGARTPDTEIYTYGASPPFQLASLSRVYTTGMYGWRFEYVYDDQGRLSQIKKIDRYWSNVLVWQRHFEYDEQNRIRSEEAWGQDPFIRWRYEYDHLGPVETERRMWNYEGLLAARTVYGRNSRGDLIRETEYGGGELPLSEIRYYYRYDDRGNWTARYVARTINRASGGGAASVFGEVFDVSSYYLRSYTYR
jgi:hypothetical protein